MKPQYIIILFAVAAAGMVWYFTRKKPVPSMGGNLPGELPPPAPVIVNPVTPRPAVNQPAPVVPPRTNNAALASYYGLTEKDFNICRDVAQKLYNSLQYVLSPDNEAIVKQLNRLGGPKSVAATQFLFQSMGAGNMAVKVNKAMNVRPWLWDKVKEVVRKEILNLAVKG